MHYETGAQPQPASRPAAQPPPRPASWTGSPSAPPPPFLFAVAAVLGSAKLREYPSGLLIERNLMHELGVWGKQTSAFFQGT